MEFMEISSDNPSGIPHHNASRKLNAARDAMMTAHNRLNDYLSSGIVPDDLKRSG